MADELDSKRSALDRLTPGERELLRLLAAGHTAKSLAALKGLSVASVNERFRAARRKTGAGSSRELARLLVAQEARHDFIGLAPAEKAEADLAPRAPPLGRARKFRWAGGAAVLMAGVIAAVALTQPAPQSTTGNPAPAGPVAAIEEPFVEHARPPDVRELRAKVRAEARRDDRQRRLEAALRSSYARTPYVAEAVETLNITCGDTLCEVVGSTRPGIPREVDAGLVENLQGRELHEAAAALGLTAVTQSFGTSASRPGQPWFLTYWTTKPNKDAR